MGMRIYGVYQESSYTYVHTHIEFERKHICKLIGCLVNKEIQYVII